MDLIYDWNIAQQSDTRPPRPLQLDDETLRDGLQAAYVNAPPLEDRIRLLELMEALGIHTANIGLPGAGGDVRSDTLALAQAMVDRKLTIAANCAARTVEADILSIAEIVQRTGRPIEACLFLGSSPIRMDVEGWDLSFLIRTAETAIRRARSLDLDVMFVTEDTTRAKPDDIRALYLAAIQAGANRICLCDTVGHATPIGAQRLVEFVNEVLLGEHLTHVGVDWHGHMDRGLGLWNAIVAHTAGADRIHATALGIGERVGNVPMDGLLVNLKLMGWITSDLTALAEYVVLASRGTGVAVPPNYPAFGSGAFETGTGVHAAAIIKAMRRGDQELADQVYSGVPAHWVGRKQVIRVGPMSGKSNAVWWLTEQGYEPRDALVDAILVAAKNSARLLTDQELHLIASAKKSGEI